MSERYLDVVLQAMSVVQDPKAKLALRDLSIDLTNKINADRMAKTLSAVSQVEGAAVTLEDAQLLDVLLGKAVTANGFNPELTTGQVGRAISVITHAMTRTMAGTLSLEELEYLDQVFDLAVDVQPPENRSAIRFLESKVRLGLGTEPRGLGSRVPTTDTVS